MSLAARRGPPSSAPSPRNWQPSAVSLRPAMRLLRHPDAWRRLHAAGLGQQLAVAIVAGEDLSLRRLCLLDRQPQACAPEPGGLELGRPVVDPDLAVDLLELLPDHQPVLLPI